MLNQIKELSDLRKYYLIYQFFTKSVNIFLIAITIKLISTIFGDFGLILKDYALPILGLFIFIPFVSGYIIDNPLKSFTYIIFIEIGSIVFYSLAELGVSPTFFVIAGMLTLTLSNVFVAPLRAKNTSEVINGCKDYSILSEQINALFTLFIAIIGIMLLTYDVTTHVNIVMAVICLLCSRYTYILVLRELHV